MRVLINLLNFRPGKIGGTETYLRELVAHLPLVAGTTRITLLTSRDVAGEFHNSPLEVAALPLSTRQVCALRVLEAATESYRARSIEATIERLRPDVVLYPQQSMFPRVAPCPAVLVVHDLYHLHCPQYLSTAQRWFRARSYPRALTSADRLIAVSEFTRRAVLDHFPCDPRRVAVVPHGVRAFAPRSIVPYEGIASPYLYYPAATLPHKNHALLFRTIARLRAQGRFPYRLVLTGAQTRHWKRLTRLRQELALEDVVIHLGYVPYATVLRLVRGAECVVFPSEFEGFGIPVIEAASLERKVITSKLDVFAEIGVPDRYRIDFADPQSLEAALMDRASTGLTRPPATWTDCAKGTLSVLMSAAAEIRSLPMAAAAPEESIRQRAA